MAPTPWLASVGEARAASGERKRPTVARHRAARGRGARSRAAASRAAEEVRGAFSFADLIEPVF